MSKKELHQYLKPLTKKQLEEQITELYLKFKEVKIYYDFAFNPNEKKLIEEAKIKISNEYYPIKSRKAKKRRSVAQKFIKHFVRLGVDPTLIIDVMLYHIEVAQAYCYEFPIKQEAFYQSILKSYNEAYLLISEQGLLSTYSSRMIKILDEVNRQNWINKSEFEQFKTLYTKSK